MDHEITPRDRIRAWLRDEMARRESFTYEDVATAAVTHFKKDRAFCRAFLDDQLYRVIYDMGRKEIRNDRNGLRTGWNVGARTAHQERVETLDIINELEAPGWGRWREKVGDEVVPLLRMTKRQLRAAAEVRRRQGDGFYKDAAFYDALADALSDEQAVGDVWKAPDIGTLYESLSLQVKVNVKLLRAPEELKGAAD